MCITYYNKLFFFSIHKNIESLLLSSHNSCNRFFFRIKAVSYVLIDFALLFLPDNAFLTSILSKRPPLL